MRDLQERFRLAHVTVVGDLMLDEYLSGSVSRISPEAPVPVVDVRHRQFVPGGAANVAANVRGLGAVVRLVGLCGQDAVGASLRSVLAGAGISDEHVVASERRVTTSKTRVVAGQQQIVRFDNESRLPIDAAEQTALLGSFEAALDGSDVCLFSDYGKGLLGKEFCGRAIELARGRGCPVIVDPKGTDYCKYLGCTLITPNLREAAQASGQPIEDDDDLFSAGRVLLRQLPGSKVLVTRGADGMTLFQPDVGPLTIPTVAQEVFDVVGAGDTVAATLGVCLAAGLSLEAATRIANAAAGIVVAKRGTVAVSADELLGHPEVIATVDGMGPN